MRGRLIAVLLGVASLLSACGGDDAGDSAPGVTSPGEVFQTLTTVPATSVPATTAATSVPPTTAPGTTAAPTVPTIPRVTTTSPRPTTTTTPPPTMEQARRYYSRVSDDYNAQYDVIWARRAGRDDQLSWREMPLYCQALSGAEKRWADRIDAFEFPARAADEVAAEVAVTRRLIRLLGICADRPGTQAAQDRLWDRIDAVGEELGAANRQARRALGL